ncbi:MAG: hypothetical protein ACFFCD_09475 [Promethearchaeota archaeon]
MKNERYCQERGNDEEEKKKMHSKEEMSNRSPRIHENRSYAEGCWKWYSVSHLLQMGFSRSTDEVTISTPQ